jgi:6-phosphogluconate dehydrogenase
MAAALEPDDVFIDTGNAHDDDTRWRAGQRKTSGGRASTGVL